MSKKTKRKRTALLLAGIIILIVSVVAIDTLKNRPGDQQEGQIEVAETEEAEDSIGTEEALEDELEGVYDDNSMKPTAKGVDIVGLWTNKQNVKTPEDMSKGPYKAYDFNEYQFVTKIDVDADGNTKTTYGTWEIKENEKGTVHIQWRNIDNEIISEESLKYSVKDKQLIIDDVVCSSLPQEDAYFSLFR